MFEAAPVCEPGFAATKRDEVDVSQKCPPTCPGRGVRPRIRSIPHYNLSGAIGVGGRRRRAANRRFAVADADWESVGGAWTPESEGFAAEQVESRGDESNRDGDRRVDGAEKAEDNRI